MTAERAAREAAFAAYRWQQCQREDRTKRRPVVCNVHTGEHMEQPNCMQPRRVREGRIDRYA